MYDSQSKSIRADEPLAVLPKLIVIKVWLRFMLLEVVLANLITYEVVETLCIIQFYANNYLANFCHRMFWVVANLLKYF